MPYQKHALNLQRSCNLQNKPARRWTASGQRRCSRAPSSQAQQSLNNLDSDHGISRLCFEMIYCVLLPSSKHNAKQVKIKGSQEFSHESLPGQACAIAYPRMDMIQIRIRIPFTHHPDFLGSLFTCDTLSAPWRWIYLSGRGGERGEGRGSTATAPCPGTS